MSSASDAAWRCSVCGYVHRGDGPPPGGCPVCGAAAADFEPYADEPAPAAARPAASRWQCLNCSYVHEAGAPPAVCPVCGAAADRFEPLPEPEPAAASASAGGALRVTVVGAGIAGVSAVEAVRRAVPAAEIVLLSREPALPYYRLNLTRYLAGEIDRDALPLHPESWYRDNAIDLRPGVDVLKLDPAGQAVTLADRSGVRYDRLILAMGSHPFVPPLQGADLDGVLTLRTAEDAQRLLRMAKDGARLACIGGGILGLETAGALARRGADITLLESHGWLMPRQLNREAGARLKRHLADLGIKLRENARTEAVVGSRRAAGVRLQGGDVVPADGVVIATGVRPNTHLARQAGLEVNRGIVVNNHLATSDPRIYAAGDVAEHNGTVYGVWAASQYQGTIAGLNAAGVPTVFGGLPRSNTLKVLGLDLLSIGQFEPEDGSFVVVDKASENNYVHFVFRDGYLAGAILMGPTAIGPAARRAIERRSDASAVLARTPAGDDIVQWLEGLPG